MILTMTDEQSPAGFKLASAPPRWVYFAIFTISGFSGLIYQSIWSHYLKLFLGHAAYAQTLVLIIFMGGMAVGAWLTARLAHRWRTPILIYAIVEGVIGVMALLFHDVFGGLTTLFYETLLPGVGSPTLGHTLKWAAAAILIIPQSILLGMTFPLMSGGIIRRFPTETGGTLAMLYFTNSIGAAVGVLASGFLFIKWVGLPGTILTAGLLNIGLALVVWVLVKMDPEPAGRVPAAEDKGESGGLAKLLLLGAFVTGAASFVYEITWIRMLSLVLGATTHSFELMLSAFITGLAFGGLWIKRRIDTLESPLRFAGLVQILMGIMAILTVPLYFSTFDWMSTIMAGLQRSDEGYTLFTASSHAIALAIMLPSTFLAGMTLPLFTHILMVGGQGERAIGQVYAANTIGAIVGVLFAVHVGLPFLGMESLMAFAAALDIGLGLYLISRAVQTRGTFQFGHLAGAGALLLVGFVALTVRLDPLMLSSGVYRHGDISVYDDGKVVYHRDGKTATITLLARDPYLTISTNGKPDASIVMNPSAQASPDEITMVMAGALPLAYRPDAKIVGNIGLGSGLTTHTLLADPTIQQVDTVEIESGMAEAARGFGERVERAFTDPRSQIHVEDAKTFFSLRGTEYDIIIAEPSNPWVSGVSSLFSEEFYRTIRNYIAEDGLFVQWLQLYEFNDELVFSVLKALAPNFEDYAIYNSNDTDVLIIASPHRMLPEPDFGGVISGPLRKELAHVGLATPDDFRVRQTASPELVEALFPDYGVPANSDFFPFLDLNAGAARFRGEVALLMQSWSVAAVPLLEMLNVTSVTPSQVTRDPHFQRARVSGIAADIHTIMSSPDSDRELNLGMKSAITALGVPSTECREGQFDRTWLYTWHTLAAPALPNLSPEDAVNLLETAAPEECVALSPPHARRWLELYRAIGARDAGSMVTAAEALLAETEAGGLDRVNYVLAAGLLGSVALGDREKAQGLWEAHGPRLAEASITPEIRLLERLSRSEGALNLQARD